MIASVPCVFVCVCVCVCVSVFACSETNLVILRERDKRVFYRNACWSFSGEQSRGQASSQ